MKEFTERFKITLDKREVKVATEQVWAQEKALELITLQKELSEIKKKLQQTK